MTPKIMELRRRCVPLHWFKALLLCVGYLISLVHAEDDGTRFIAQKAAYVKQIALRAEVIDSNCSLLADCGNECSRLVCYPLKEDLQAYCGQVDINTLCQPTDRNQTSCRQMKLNYERSYLTLPPPGTTAQLTPEMTRDICLQRALDDTFKNVSSKSQFSFVYFGSASGVFRAFPGREREGGTDKPSTCGNYQLPQRPWYKSGISVRKQLKILVDTGISMSYELPANYPPGSGNTLLEVASNMILKMLKTVSPDDFVDVAAFNSSGYYPLGPQVQVSSEFDDNPDSTELAALEAGVKSNLKTRSLPGNSNLTGAILSAVQSFNNVSDTLKVIVIFTDGAFSPLDNVTFPTAQILGLPVKVMLYKFPPKGDKDPYLSTTTLPNILCGVKGSFELLDAVHSTLNPPYAIRSYYTFMARTHLAVVNNQATWSARFVTYSQPLNGTTVTYPAFGSDGLLIGVAGINVFPEQLDGTLRDMVYRALDNTSAMGNMPAPAASINLTCSYPMKARSESCNGSAVANGGICEATDTTGLQQRVCCDSCLAVTDSPDSNKVGLKIGLPVALLAALLLIIAVCGLIYCKTRQLYCWEPEPEHEYYGSDRDIR